MPAITFEGREFVFDVDVEKIGHAAFAVHFKNVPRGVFNEITGRKKVRMAAPVTKSVVMTDEDLIEKSRRCMCVSAVSEATRLVMLILRYRVRDLDEHMSRKMVRECVYRNGFCPMSQSCGFVQSPVIFKELRDWYGKDGRRRSAWSDCEENI